MDAPALQIYRDDTVERGDTVDRGDAATDKTLPVRGIAWVLRWTAALGMFVFASLVLTSFACQVAAELALRHAAAAGLREAALPRATSESVESAVQHDLTTQNRRLRSVRIQLGRNGVPVRGALGSAGSGPLSLKLSAAAADVTPRWLSFLSGEIAITVRSVAAH